MPITVTAKDVVLRVNGKLIRPVRIQRKRTKGWRMPEGAVYVGRPTQWGNPFRIGHHYKRDVHGGIPHLGIRFIFLEAFEGHHDATYTTIRTREEAVDWFRWYVGRRTPDQIAEMRLVLRDKDLACFCPLDQVCHADVLLELANA